MTHTTEIAQSVLDFVRDELLAEGTHLADVDSPLLDGAVDSLGLMQIVGFVEDEFGVEIDTADITTTHFRTPTAIGDLVAAKLAGRHADVTA